MGLHVHTTRTIERARITVFGRMSGHATSQLQAVIDHYQSQGCKRIEVDFQPENEAEMLLRAAESLAFSQVDEAIAIR